MNEHIFPLSLSDFQNLTYSNVHTTPYPVSKCIQMNDPKKGIIINYGELSPLTVEEVIAYLNVREDDVYYELGCGKGRCCFQFFFCSMLKKVVGIEIEARRVNIALNSLEEFKRNKRNGLRLYFNNEREIIFLKENILNIDFSEATILYTCSWSREWQEGTLNKYTTQVLNRSKKIRYVIALHHMKDLVGMYVAKVIRVKSDVYWGELAEFLYIHEKAEKHPLLQFIEFYLPSEVDLIFESEQSMTFEEKVSNFISGLKKEADDLIMLYESYSNIARFMSKEDYHVVSKEVERKKSRVKNFVDLLRMNLETEQFESHPEIYKLKSRLGAIGIKFESFGSSSNSNCANVCSTVDKSPIVDSIGTCDASLCIPTNINSAETTSSLQENKKVYVEMANVIIQRNGFEYSLEYNQSHKVKNSNPQNNIQCKSVSENITHPPRSKASITSNDLPRSATPDKLVKINNDSSEVLSSNEAEYSPEESESSSKHNSESSPLVNHAPNEIIDEISTEDEMEGNEIELQDSSVRHKRIERNTFKAIEASNNIEVSSEESTELDSPDSSEGEMRDEVVVPRQLETKSSTVSRSVKNEEIIDIANDVEENQVEHLSNEPVTDADTEILEKMNSLPPHLRVLYAAQYCSPSKDSNIYEAENDNSILQLDDESSNDAFNPVEVELSGRNNYDSANENSSESGESGESNESNESSDNSDSSDELSDSSEDSNREDYDHDIKANYANTSTSEMEITKSDHQYTPFQSLPESRDVIQAMSKTHTNERKYVCASAPVQNYELSTKEKEMLNPNKSELSHENYSISQKSHAFTIPKAPQKRKGSQFSSEDRELKRKRIDDSVNLFEQDFNVNIYQSTQPFEAILIGKQEKSASCTLLSSSNQKPSSTMAVNTITKVTSTKLVSTESYDDFEDRLRLQYEQREKQLLEQIASLDDKLFQAEQHRLFSREANDVLRNKIALLDAKLTESERVNTDLRLQMQILESRAFQEKKRMEEEFNKKLHIEIQKIEHRMSENFLQEKYKIEEERRIHFMLEKFKIEKDLHSQYLQQKEFAQRQLIIEFMKEKKSLESRYMNHLNERQHDGQSK